MTPEPAGLLIANRGEIAVRIARAAANAGLRSVAVFSEDDAASLHVRMADEAVALRGSGPAAYLDAEELIRAAREAGCHLVHPGYGFLSESDAFARECAEAGLVFAGPEPGTLALLGDKASARRLAAERGVPVPAGTEAPATVEDVEALLRSLGDGGAVMVKAVAGGGGRGMRVVRDPGEVAAQFERCASEATSAFGRGELYAEQLLEDVRHIEVQVIGDGSGAVVALGDRDCSVQRRHQKVVEIAPAPDLPDRVRAAMADAAVDLAGAVRFRGLGTFEFLVPRAPAEGAPGFVFLEANPRLQVEHTVTEEVLGLDLVVLGLQVAQGASLADLGLVPGRLPAPRGIAIQARVNAETMQPDGTALPAAGELSAFQPPTGPGVRTDTYAYAGYATNPRFDSLLAKVVVFARGADLAEAAARTHRALREFRIEGVATNLPFLRAVLAHPAFVRGEVVTSFVDEHAGELAGAPSGEAPFPPATEQVAAADPASNGVVLPPGTEGVGAPQQGAVVSVLVAEGDVVRAGTPLLILEAMKMEHEIVAPAAGTVRGIAVGVGDVVPAEQLLVVLEPGGAGESGANGGPPVDPDFIRADLRETLDRHALTLDEGRPEAVAKRHGRGRRTARENLAELVDEGSFVEYGALVVAAQRQRRTEDELIRATPADGLVGGVARVNGDLFGDDGRCAVLSYDYMVFAGTQGLANHRKKDRLFGVIERLRLPVVFFAEGGGGRPGDVETEGPAQLPLKSFAMWGGLSGLVPRIAVVSGPCFAGNGAIAGGADLIIATPDATIGMGGPAMIEGGGLGKFPAADVGPVSVQAPNGVLDVVVHTEDEAIATAKKVLGYFQGPVAEWSCADQRTLRSIVPENRLRSYDARRVFDVLFDSGSVTELRAAFAPGMLTALARIEGRPVGVIGNNPLHLSGAITSAAADKAARFLQLCDAFDLPVVSLIDTPGIMVGPDAEATALVRHANRLFVTGPSLTVPMVAVVLRKAYGLGAQAMAGGGFHETVASLAWPTGEVGAMGLEGAVRLGYRKELEAIEDPEEQQRHFDERLAEMYRKGKALTAATYFEFDDVIDPADTRRIIASVLAAAPAPPPREGKKRPFVDTW